MLSAVLPIPLASQSRAPGGECGRLLAQAVSANYGCSRPIGDRGATLVTFLALCLLSFVVGSYTRRASSYSAAVPVATLSAGLIIWLLCWPVSAEDPGSCGSPLLTSYGAMEDRSDDSRIACASIRSNRLARALAIVAFALPTVVVIRARED